MKENLVNRTGVAAPAISRRSFVGAAAATGVAGIVPAGLGSLSLEQSAMKVAQFVLPTATKDVAPFEVHVPQAALDDLKLRLASTRWPERETVRDWSQGVPLQKAQALIAYWRDKYDWRRFEARLNAPRSTGSAFTSSTCAPLTGTRCRSFSRTDGRDRSWSSWRSSARSAIPPGTGEGPRTRSMSSCRRSRASPSPTSQWKRAGT